MHLQSIIVAVIVAACAVYVAWTLMPSAARRQVALRLLAHRLPEPLAARMRRHAQASSGCGCDGCDKAPAQAPPPAVQAIRFHPRPPR
ncbi:MAG: DUF6587 family protein [Caldimonas sp.]